MIYQIRKSGYHEKANCHPSLIDLIFISNSLLESCKDPPKINKNTPSDYSMITFSIEINKSSQYSVEEFYFDTTRRPRINKKIEK